MTLFHVLQLLLLAAVIGLVVERIRALCYGPALDAPAFRRALLKLIRNGDEEHAWRFVARARPAFVADAIWPLIDPNLQTEERALRLEDGLLELRIRVRHRLRLLRGLATIGSSLGFIGAAIEIRWIVAGDHGLLRLQAGLIENIGLSNAALSVALGMATTTLAAGGWGSLRGVARRLDREAHRAVLTLEEALGMTDWSRQE